MTDFEYTIEDTFVHEPAWQEPSIIEDGWIEGRLFSDEPDPWGP